MDWILRALYDIKINFIFYIVGVDEKEFIMNNLNLKQYITNKIHFIGKISKNECEKYMSDVDFIFLVRENCRLAKYGFSTKLMDSFKYKIPLIATDTSDNATYIKDNYNGFICLPTEHEFREKMNQIFSMEISELHDVRENIDSSRLLTNKYYHIFSEIIN